MGTRAIGSSSDTGVSPSVDAQIKSVLNSDPDVVAARSGKIGPTEGKGKKRVVMDRERGNDDRVTGGDPAPERAPRRAGRKDYSPTHTARPPGARLKEGAGKRAGERAPQVDKEDEFDRNLQKVLAERDEEVPYEPQRGRYAGRGDVAEEVEEDEVEEGEEADAVETDERDPEEERDEVDDGDAEEEESDEDAEVEEQPAKGKKLSLEKALRILRLEKWSTAALSKLSDEEKIQLASDRLEARRVTEAKFEAQAKELAELKQSKSAAKDDKAPTSTEQVTPAPGDETFDVRKLATRLSKDFGDETVEAVSEPIMAAVSHLEKRIEARAASFVPIISMVVETRVAMARNRLERVHPELESDALFDKVKKLAQKLDWDAYGGDIDAIYHDAAAIALGHRSQGDSRSSGRAARRRAQPHVGSRRTVGERLTPHDAFGKIAAAFDAGDAELARQIHRSIA